MWCLATVLHEAGHAVAALVLTNDRVVIRFSRHLPRWRFQLGRLRIEGSGLPLQGVTASSDRLKESRLRSAAVLIAGPAVSLLAGLVALVALRTSGPNAVMALSLSAFAINLSAAAVSLIPVRGGTTKLPTDGLQLLSLAFGAAIKPKPVEIPIAALLAEPRTHSPGGETLEALKKLDSAFPDLRMRIEPLASCGDRVATRATFYGTHLAPFDCALVGLPGTIPATGHVVSWSAISVLRRDGLDFTELVTVEDSLGLLLQLEPHPPGGAVPPQRPAGDARRGDGLQHAPATGDAGVEPGVTAPT
jgi:hypothetical protein